MDKNGIHRDRLRSALFILRRIPIGFVSIIIDAFFLFWGLSWLAYRRAETLGPPAALAAAPLALSGLAVVGVFYAADQLVWFGDPTANDIVDAIFFGSLGLTVLTVLLIGLWPQKRLAQAEAP